MNKPWKLLLPLLIGGGLTACANTNPSAETASSDVESPDVIAHPIHPVPPPVIEVQAKHTADGRLILGEQEWVYIPGLEESFKARIDTGATTSSISATDIVPFERDGKDWVKFKIEHDNIKSKEMALPVDRWVKIRQSSAEGTQRRAVVQAWIQIGDVKEKTAFTLADRTHLTFPVLLGRSFFNNVALVDVSKKYVQDKRE
ncbi:ATP-dependent zinc protease family protein [Vibrio sp. LaRot3]|uniref:ATP-dependent zinc protease family protein n=1 Tax=Vibrio sp. LaRot3 TaxID=2998829 RepID=UPI0022CDE36B|nr:ATP-dependent zinc protease [Vibrio sp. LaRot3]MDA0148392.1 ATP-dependent zinc protease [Vibrio sp. LaRot3]